MAAEQAGKLVACGYIVIVEVGKGVDLACELCLVNGFLAQTR